MKTTVKNAFEIIQDEHKRLHKALNALIDDVLCLCGEGPDVIAPGAIHKALIRSAKKARQDVGEREE